jgi:hypothetical protein
VTTDTPTDTKTITSPAASDGLQDHDDQPVLDLSESLKRAIVVGPDGKSYELRTPEEFSVEDEHLLRSELEQFSALQQKGTLDKKENARLRLRLDTAFNRLLVGSNSEKALFNDRLRQRVLLFFRTQWAQEDLAAVREARDQIERAAEGADDSTLES